MAKLPDAQKNRRGITVDGTPSTLSPRSLCLMDSHRNLDYLYMAGTDGSIFAIGDCTATSYAPTAQVASQQGAYIARLLAQMAKKDSVKQELADLEKRAMVITDEEEKKRLQEEMNAANKQLAKVKLKPFHYSHQGSLAWVYRLSCFFRLCY